MEDKKKRGNNYTAQEKEYLLDLIKNYLHIIENKETNAHMSSKKRETWEAVCRHYNSVAVSGVRTWQQLRHFYENTKQRSKKIVPEMNLTGSGAYGNSVTGEEAQAMVDVQILPLSNPYDDAALPDNQNAATVTQMCNNTELLSTSRTTATPGRGKSAKSEKHYKLEYFKAKLRNAQLENKYIINKNRMELNKYKLEMEILRLRLQKLRSLKLKSHR